MECSEKGINQIFSGDTIGGKRAGGDGINHGLDRTNGVYGRK